MIEPFVQALLNEIDLRHGELRGETVSSIYLGGGTPGLLTPKQLDALFNRLLKHFSLTADAEITLEANPDDLTPERIEALTHLPINRLSIGVQSFNDNALQEMNRSHSAKQAKKAIAQAVPHFPSTTIDLIYGRPHLTEAEWLNDLNEAQALGIKHLSCYALTVEENTKLAHDIRKGKHKPILDDDAAKHFALLQQWANDNAWEHYEISNLCKPGYRAVHNWGYWHHMRYLGLGPGAHGFDGLKRSANKADLRGYTQQLLKHKKPPQELDYLSPADRFNEWVMTGLRTAEGLNLVDLQRVFPKRTEQLLMEVEEVDTRYLIRTKNAIKLSSAGFFFADGIAAQLFTDE